MKILNSRFYFCLYLTLFITSLFFQILFAKKENDLHVLKKIDLTIAGTVSTFTAIKNTLQGLKKVSDFIISGINFLSKLAGVRAILLFLFIIILSSGYSVIGIPKGKTLFFLSLFTADVLWFIFIKTFSDSSLSFVIILKTNLVVLAPFFMIYLMKRIVPLLIKRIKFWMIANFTFFKRRAMDKATVINLSERFAQMSLNLNKSVTMDIVSSNKKIIFSGMTDKNIKELRNILLEFHNMKETKKAKD